MRSRLGLERNRGAFRLWLSLAFLAVLRAASAQAPSEAILDYTDNISAFVSTTVGWTFQSAKALTVTDLGCFAGVFDENPALTAVQVGLWDHVGTLLASTSITASNPLFDQTRYEPVPPVALQSNQVYHVGVYYSGGSVSVNVAGTVAGGSVTTSPGIQLRAAASSSGGFTFPQEVAGTTGSIYAGPNFAFQPQPALTIEVWTGNQVRLSWSTAFPGFTLQSELGLSGTWTNSGLAVTTVGNQYIAFDSRGGVPKYYRLIK